MMRFLAALMVFLVMGQGPAVRADEFIIDKAEPFCVTGMDDMTVCHHVYGGADISVRALKCWEDAGLSQVSTRLEIPVEGAVEKDSAAARCDGQKFKVHVPKVDHETLFRFTGGLSDASAEDKIAADVTQQDAAPKQDAPQASARFYFRAYPRTLMDAVKSWASFEGNALIVQDKEGRLLDFLDKHEVKYLTRDTMPNAERKLHIVVGQPPEREEMDDIKGDVMYLTEKTDILPVVRIRETPKRMTVKIKTKLLDSLAADDPLATKAFVEIFKEIAK